MSKKMQNKDVIKIYSEINSELVNSWQELYNLGGNYNLSPDWCTLWFKYFKRKRNLYIITIWENDELKLLAPFYIYRNRLSLLGTKPDMYDEFNILYSDVKYINKLIDYIIENKLEINFKHVNCESEFSKVLVKSLSSKGIRYISHVTELKPFLNRPFEPKRKLKDDLKRCKNNAVKLYKEELCFEYNIEDRKNYIKEFMTLHKKRWNGGMLVKKANLELFVEDLLMRTDLTTFSRLSFSNINQTVAYHLGYVDSNNTFCSSMPVYNTDFKPISPGKVLLNELITEVFNKNINKFDFGRGSEPYKSWFSDNESVLFNL
ncbi:MAG: GNAT family N-acetyltransferase, partial [Candidatus Gastranaerophilales bacterium]|nr:GNAT family N-acetyltransferase [Candidatus Gastranaerophilales bacterium]